MSSNFERTKRTAAAITAAAAMGALAAKANALPQKDTIESNTPHLISSGLHPEQAPSSRVSIEKLSPEQYKVAKRALDGVNNGPANENIIDVGGMRLMKGTKIYKAPMESALDYVVPKNKTGFWWFERLIPVSGELWAAARRVMDMQNGHTHEIPLYSNGATDPNIYSWVKISQAEKVPGFEHVVPVDPDFTHGAKPWDLPPVYQIQPDKLGNIIIDQPHPNVFSNFRYLANFDEGDIKYLNPIGNEISLPGQLFMPTKAPVRFIKASVPK